MPFFSVIVPAYNRADSISKVINSVLVQSFKDFELILVNDGSTDDTLSCINTFTVDNRIKVYSQLNKGVSAARNTGIERSTGKYVVFLDSDDIVEKNWLNDFHTLIKSGFEIGCCGYKIFDGNTYDIKMPPKLSPIFHNYKASFLAGSFFVKKSILNKIGNYDQSLSFSENFELGMRLTSYCFINKLEIGIFSATNLIIFQDQDRINKYSSKKLFSSIKLLKKYKTLFSVNLDDHLDYLSIAGVEAMRLGKNKTARIFILKSIILVPTNIKNFLRLIISFSPPLIRLFYKK
jgi:glycosyltransferase involved in cell wall biosynthesis